MLEQGTPRSTALTRPRVRTKAGEDWFAHFQQRGSYGRVHLQPMRWATTAGRCSVTRASPSPYTASRDDPPQPPSAPATDDDFPGGRFGRQWQWTANRQDGGLPSTRGWICR